ncbi:hypothetical protein OUZ56_009236 [Daphnia magna]|uniref:Uncharacterized protein n=1 Tax=Daphnia magna TaxID=35525 RepID=A0ABR0AFF1_9CRUS|nr:hypothetical protein OUZ56_009236 [Daphnia magna]
MATVVDENVKTLFNFFPNTYSIHLIRSKTVTSTHGLACGGGVVAPRDVEWDGPTWEKHQIPTPASHNVSVALTSVESSRVFEAVHIAPIHSEV